MASLSHFHCKGEKNGNQITLLGRNGGSEMFERWDVGGVSWEEIRTIYAELFIAIIIAVVMLVIAKEMGIV